MRLAIIGSGSLGSLFAGFLSSQVDLLMVGHWPAQIARLREFGLTIIHLDGRRTHHTFPVIEDPVSSAPVEVAIVLVKSYQTLRAAKETNQLLAPDGIAITLQNGLGNLEKLGEVLGPDRVTQGVTSLGANVIEPGLVRHTGVGNVLLAVTEDNESLIRQVAGWMNNSGLETELTGNLDGLLWGKLAINSGINPLTALLRVPNGFVATNEFARGLAVAAAEETAVIAGHLGITLPFADAGKRVIEVAENTASNHSSMLQDVIRHAPTEIDAICGEVVRYGERVGVPTPINGEFLRLLSQPVNVSLQSSKIKPLQLLLSTRALKNGPE